VYYYRRLRDLREDSDKSQKEIAEYLEISQVQYHRYESGKREIPYHLVIKLADYYNVSVDYISELSDEKSRRNITLTDDELSIIRKFRTLNDRLKGRLLERLDFLYSQNMR